MAFGRTFSQVYTDVALELGRNTSPTAVKGWLDKIKVLVRRCYEELLDEHDWTMLRAFFEKVTQAGQQFYDFPELAQYGKFYSPVAIVNGQTFPLTKGISVTDYATYNPNTDRADPPMKWDVRVDADGTPRIEIWPVPASDGTSIWFTGQYGAGDLVDDDDIVLLDDVLVRLWALMEQSEGEARRNFKTLQGKAQRRLQLQKALFAPSGDGFDLSGKVQYRSTRRPPEEIRVIRGS